MPKQKRVSKKQTAKVAPKLTKTEEDLLWHLENGYQLESAIAGGPILRNLKDQSTMRTASANQSTIHALEERGLVTETTDGLTTTWKAKKKS